MGIPLRCWCNLAVLLTASLGAAWGQTALNFVPVTPCRVVDTRNGPGPIAAGATVSFNPVGSCGIPSTAQAYSLNVAVVPSATLNYITVWPAGETQPSVSTINSRDGRTKSNAAVIPAGTGGAINVFPSDATQVIIDIYGYFVPASTSGSLAFYPLPPCRVLDTRHNTLLSGQFPGGASRTVPMLSSNCNLPAAAQAWSLNFTVVAPGQVGYLTAYPTGSSQPVVATLNATPPLPLAVTPVVVANAAIVPAGNGGSIDIYASNTTDLVIDINGYFAPPGAGGLSLYTVAPCRAFDTRVIRGGPGPFSGTINVSIGSACGASAASLAYLFNTTVVPPGPPAQS